MPYDWQAETLFDRTQDSAPVRSPCCGRFPVSARELVIVGDAEWDTLPQCCRGRDARSSAGERALCGACRQRLFNVGGINREDFYAAIGAPPGVVDRIRSARERANAWRGDVGG